MKSKAYLIRSIDFYQRHISRCLRPSCKFYPSCSDYAKEAIGKYGAWSGASLAFKRILRCHPWQENQVDKVP